MAPHDHDHPDTCERCAPVAHDPILSVGDEGIWHASCPCGWADRWNNGQQARHFTADHALNGDG